MTPTPEQLKRALAKMLPERVVLRGEPPELFHRFEKGIGLIVRDTELPALVREAELGLSDGDDGDYFKYVKELTAETERKAENGDDIDLKDVFSPLWQTRLRALAKVKGVEVV